MTRIAHISDLHFGRTDVELLNPLLAAVNGARPDLVAVTGDFTQRARVSQYREARAFLDRLEAPWMAVPGNHDVSLDNLWMRFIRPYKRYREHICNDLFPTFRGAGIVAVGLNTVDRYRWQRGKVRWFQLRQACRIFGESEGTKLVLAHHPFEQDADVKKSLMRGANKAIEQLSDCGAHIVLSGHLHRWRAEPFLSRKNRSQVLQVHVGTGLSTRLRGQENDFALLDVAEDEVAVTRMIARDGAFAEAGVRRFVYGDEGWKERRDTVSAEPVGTVRDPAALRH
ncbi:metallophosphoesterase [Salipiger thiooxidans]|uniref:metallophosphoesterase family protein n=1 Tax=Salipiger thiooxidans TaxID=282683 RepID=UPI001A9059D1|nr:metallophosphoesterase [Salipiger thiooxidans]MBN8185086.1 metallophosphoesterase [Salipiger thiooxidans]